MNDKTEKSWQAASWEGSRRAQIKRTMRLTPRQRLEAMIQLDKTAQELAKAPNQSQRSQSASRGPIVAKKTSTYSTNYPSQKHKIPLPDCNPTPLASYLKALGILRLVAEQVDPDARGYWENEQFVLESQLDEERLNRFFLEQYEPTPIIAPWNGGSGFYPNDNQSGIAPIESGNANRFDRLRHAIGVAREGLDSLNLKAKPEGILKQEFLAFLRAYLDDQALGWLDAAVLLTEDNPKYPPLLGTGGNDGRLDFTNNFLQRLVELLDADSGQPNTGSQCLLQESLISKTIPGVISAAVGQFAPGDAGGPNQTSGFEAKSVINPWDFVFMLEGAVLFAASATRRLETDESGVLSYPFTVRVTAGGSGIAALGDEANARAEIWVPLWSSPTSLNELETLLSEGRATLGRRPVRDGLDFARAVARLGVDRGIDTFQRYAFLMRSGKAYFATPLNRIDVNRNPAADLIDELEQGAWLSRFRRFARNEGSHRLRTLLRNLETAIFQLTLDHRDAAASTRTVLIHLGNIDRHLSRSPKAREICPPIPSLSSRWITQAEPGGGIEFALAAALAGLHGRKGGEWVYPMRLHLAPEQPGQYPRWDEQAAHQVTWGAGDAEPNLIATLQRRLLDAERLDLDDKPLAPSRTASLAQVAAWLAGEVDTTTLTELLPGLMLTRIPSGRVGDDLPPLPLPAAYRLLKPFFATNGQLRRAGLLPADQHLPIPADMVRRLAAGQVDPVMARAMRALRIAGLVSETLTPAPGIHDGQWLLAALMAPISDYDLQRLLPRTLEQEGQQAS